MNKTQKIPTFRPGQSLRADSLNHTVQALLGMIVQGRGIEVKMVGQKLQISALGGPIPRTGGGGGDQVDYTAASKTLLEAYTGVVEYARGRVTAGADKGVVYVRNPDNDGWDALNRLE